MSDPLTGARGFNSKARIVFGIACEKFDLKFDARRRQAEDHHVARTSFNEGSVGVLPGGKALGRSNIPEAFGRRNDKSARGRCLQFRQGPDLYAHARRFGSALDHFTGGGIADQGSRPTSRNFAKGHLQQAGQSEFTHAARMYRSQYHAFQRGEDAHGGLARNIVLLGDQVDQRGLGEGFLDRAKSRRGRA